MKVFKESERLYDMEISRNRKGRPSESFIARAENWAQILLRRSVRRWSFTTRRNQGFRKHLQTEAFDSFLRSRERTATKNSPSACKRREQETLNLGISYFEAKVLTKLRLFCIAFTVFITPGCIKRPQPIARAIVVSWNVLCIRLFNALSTWRAWLTCKEPFA